MKEKANTSTFKFRVLFIKITTLNSETFIATAVVRFKNETQFLKTMTPVN